MDLRIVNELNLDLSDFTVAFLVPQIVEYFTQKLDSRKLIKYDEYLNSLASLQQHTASGKTRYISSKDIVIGAMSNLVSEKQPNGDYLIRINPNEYVPNLNAKFIDIASLVNFGNLSLPAYPIFDDTFQFFADNLDFCFEDYKSAGGK